MCEYIQSYWKATRKAVCRSLLQLAKTKKIGNERLKLTLMKCSFEYLCYQTSRGVFVLALDDEQRKVREAAINSIAEIGLLNERFAKQATALLLGMLNDEADRTRVAAVKALCKLSKEAKLSVW